MNEPHSVIQLSCSCHVWSNEQIEIDAHFLQEIVRLLTFVKLFRLVNYVQKTFHQLRASTNQKNVKETLIPIGNS